MRKRSKYKPRRVLQDTLTWIKAGFKPVTHLKNELVDIKLKNQIALKDLMAGNSNHSQIQQLVGAFNITEALARMKFGQDWSSEIKDAQDALLDVSRRFKQLGRYTLKGVERTALNLAMDVHDAQLDVVTVQDVEKAMDLVNQDVRLRKARVIHA